MKFSPTRLADFLSCRHKTSLDLRAAAGELERPRFSDPFTDLLRERGEEHERRYVDRLRAQGLHIEDLRASRDPRDTEAAMRAGHAVIVQAPLGGMLGGAEWFGIADILMRVPGASTLGDWHYEAHDTKLARETRGTAILQLCVYTELLAAIQGRTPEHFTLVSPVKDDVYRVADVAAYYRLVKAQMEEHVSRGLQDQPALRHKPALLVPDPVAHCDVCVWFQRCNAERRAADHIRFVANLGRQHQVELASHGITTKRALAGWQVPEAFTPVRGSRETYVKLQDQAALQVRQADSGKPEYHMLPVEPHVAADGTPLPVRGLKRLPEPSAGDLYLDLEGDAFGPREYLFGVGELDATGQFVFRAWWAYNDQQEQRAFEEVMDLFTARIAQRPDAHIFHYAPYEPNAFKRLSGRYATRAEDLDVLLRSGRFVDLYAVVREGLRAGVESYSIKELEPFYGLHREVNLHQATRERQHIEAALEKGQLDTITPAVRDAVEGYNKDDVRSTVELHRWLEQLRATEVARGADIPRPGIPDGAAPEEVGEREARVRALKERLLGEHTQLAHMLDWHRRENKSEWWEFFRLLELSDDDLMDERKAVAKLQFVEPRGPVISEKTGKPTKSVIERYTYPPQDCDIKPGDSLRIADGKPWAEVVDIDRVQRLLDVKVGPSRQGLRPVSAFDHDVISPRSIEDALFAIGTAVADGHPPELAMALLERRAPVRAIQGPPGTGKTYRASVMICDAVAQGKTVGVTANSHTVITNLLTAVEKEATRRGQSVPILQVKHEDLFGADDPRVTGGTYWYWTSDKCTPVDTLFVDEAGQVSLANALACTVAAREMVLLGDPQQLDQPTKGVHPEGVGVSSLQHWLGDARVMPEGLGEFLNVTWRLAPSLCAFTSEAFYEGRLTAKPGLERQVLRGTPHFEGAGLRLVRVDHDGNRNCADEEVAVVVQIVTELLAPGSVWINEHGEARQMTPDDIRVVAPYNAQVTRLQEGLPDLPVGTVDKFQGQEAPVVIYSMATSRPDDAPRGLGFLYSLNRFNVATSRARCLCIIVASPHLFAPDCDTPAHMKLANALCRYVELATPNNSEHFISTFHP